ncbi:pyruvate formate-lyase-activating protein [Heliophilum fasciatum]|uniref:Pyruvate formate-lyase-activating enzyme n=1 Tax=Heliophilum fasciatum TaxID=35700 RepID=A0A4R2S0F2_9FIRM|nr:pyruvate formate-lyase-activating protein [Heliophilum fasciatum]MCW2276883.1 pyruvate formate lyase activating enzyme [Heliophilum fasciatum]TCP68657.1 pyruvate formate lyase activating enzyme [Heliophilum fasciatum]
MMMIDLTDSDGELALAGVPEAQILATKGCVHSVETCGTVDGPGIRYVLFLAGCPLRCAYCHNPDTWSPQAGEIKMVETIMAELRRYRPYFTASGGGITVSGGEPAMQAAFLGALFQRCHAEGIHTCLDTSGYCEPAQAELFLDDTDLVLLDIKQADPDKHKALTGVDNERILAFARMLKDRAIPVWIRYVVVPGSTDAPEDIDQLCRLLVGLGGIIRRVTFLPYHTLGAGKREEMGITNALVGVKPPSETAMAAIRAQARQYGLPVE